MSLVPQQLRGRRSVYECVRLCTNVCTCATAVCACDVLGCVMACVQIACVRVCDVCPGKTGGCVSSVSVYVCVRGAGRRGEEINTARRGDVPPLLRTNMKTCQKHGETLGRM